MNPYWTPLIAIHNHFLGKLSQLFWVNGAALFNHQVLCWRAQTQHANHATWRSIPNWATFSDALFLEFHLNLKSINTQLYLELVIFKDLHCCFELPTSLAQFLMNQPLMVHINHKSTLLIYINEISYMYVCLERYKEHICYILYIYIETYRNT